MVKLDYKNLKTRYFVGAAIGAAANIAGSLMQNKMIDKQIAAQSSENAKNRAYNKEQAEWQNRESKAQWDRENAYNTPAAQMARMKEAGLNPDLMYGQSSASNVAATSPEMASVAPSSPQDMSALGSKVSFGQAVSNAANRAMEYRMLNAQADKMDAEARQTEAQTQGTNVQNQFLPQLLAASLTKNDAEVQKLLSDSDVNESQRDYLASQVRVMAQNINESITRIRGIESEIENKTVTQAQNWFKLNLQQQMTGAQLKEAASRTGLNEITIKKIATLMPYEIQDLISSASLKDSEAGVHFVEQGLKVLEQLNLKIKNQQLAVLLDQARIEYERSAQTNQSYKSEDGTYSALGKAVFLLQDMVSGSIGFSFK